MVKIIFLLDIILAIICAVFIIKNLLVKYKGSENGFKNVAMIACIVIALVCSIYSLIIGNAVQEAIAYIGKVKDIEPTELIRIKQEIASGKKDIIKYTIIGYIGFFISNRIFINVKKEIKENFEKPKRKWGWNKIK